MGIPASPARAQSHGVAAAPQRGLITALGPYPTSPGYSVPMGSPEKPAVHRTGPRMRALAPWEFS